MRVLRVLAVVVVIWPMIALAIITQIFFLRGWRKP